MTQKELLYVEDAIEHEKSIIEIFNDYLNKFEDNELKNYMEDQINIHNIRKNDLLSLLQEIVNGR